MISEVLKARGCSPFFPLKQHGHKRSGEDEGCRNFCTACIYQMAKALTLCPIADLIVILRVAEEAPRRESFDRSPVDTVTMRCVDSVVDKGRFEGFGKVGHRAEIGVVTA